MKKSSLKEIFSVIKFPYALFILGIALTLGNVIISLIFPLKVQSLVDDFQHNFSINMFVIIILLLFGNIMFSVLSSYTLGVAGQRVIAQIREKLTNKLILFPVSYFEKRQSTDISSHISNDTQKVNDLISSNISTFISGLLLSIGSIIILFILNSVLTLIVMCAILLMGGLLIPIAKKQAKLQGRTQANLAKYNADLQQSISQIKLIKMSSAETFITKGLRERIQKLYKNNIEINAINSIIDPIEFSLIMGTLFFVFIIGGLMASRGQISIGKLTSFLLYVFQIITPVSNINHTLTSISSANGAAQYLIDILHEPVESTSIIKDNNTLKGSSDIYFDNVSFKYNPEQSNVLNDLNFTIKEKKTTAFVGPSGGGKTTILNLIERFYSEFEGNIFYGKVNIKDYSLRQWRSSISYVSQEQSVLFGTIRDNLTIGLTKKVTDEQINNALISASAKQFVDKLPEGLDTKLYERGQNLSGGQIQRLMIARAFLRSTPILIFDEATASLDSASEKIIDESVEKLCKDKTVIIVAHRLSTVKNADQIFFVESGKITGKGTHNELMHTHKLYRQYVNEQML